MTGQLRLPGAVLLGALVAGCYTLQPVKGVDPQVGSRLAFDVNDAGRVALGATMGPEIAQVEGQLIDKENGSYLLAVSTVRLLGGAEQVWSGEPVRLKPEYLGPAYRRRFSAGRSIGLGVAVVGGFAGFFITRSLLGSGNDESKPNPGDTVSTRRVRP